MVFYCDQQVIMSDINHTWKCIGNNLTDVKGVALT